MKPLNMRDGIFQSAPPSDYTTMQFGAEAIFICSSFCTLLAHTFPLNRFLSSKKQRDSSHLSGKVASEEHVSSWVLREFSWTFSCFRDSCLGPAAFAAGEVCPMLGTLRSKV